MYMYNTLLKNQDYPFDRDLNQQKTVVSPQKDFQRRHLLLSNCNTRKK